MSIREWWQWTAFAVTGRVPVRGGEVTGRHNTPPTVMAPGKEITDPDEAEALGLTASAPQAPERRVVRADEAAGLGLVEDTAPLDNVYRERAKLVALLAALYPSTLVLGADPEEPDWAVLFITLPTGQASWHIAADDLGLFHHVDLDDADTPGVPEWDGHSTDEKYERIAALIRTLGGRSAAPHRYLSTGCLHGDHGYCQSSTGSNGTKTPASCKFCGAGCECDCHGGSRDEFGLVSCPHCTDTYVDIDQHLTACREAPASVVGELLHCTCCCPESTHTGPGGHCVMPGCREEPCTPLSEWRAQQAAEYEEEPVPVPRDALRGLVEVARQVAASEPYPDPVPARNALAALYKARLIDRLGEESDG